MVRPRKGPPRWFAPVLIAGMVLAVAALALIGGLFDDAPQAPVRVGSRTYLFPPGEYSTLQTEPHLFVRLGRGDQPFEIVHDARAAGRHDPAGVPHIFSVNDQPGQDLLYGRVGRALVVCRRASEPAGGCGTWIQYGAATWSILFPTGRRAEADLFAQQARALLRRYDTRSRPLVP